MTKLATSYVLCAALLASPLAARAEEPAYGSGAGSGPAAAPQGTPPAEPPPAPPSETPPPPPAEAPAPQAQPSPAVPPGQWVYTQQYGWIWMPYSDTYTSVPASGSGEPCAYVYYPAFGWTWLAAPWVWGYGPWPFFGVYGPARFGWYGHGWWRYPARWRYFPAYPYRGYAGFPYRPGFRPGPWAAPRVAPYRPGFGAFHGVPGPRAAPHAGWGVRGGGFAPGHVAIGGRGGGRGHSSGHGGRGGHGRG
jgi:hypothetical protein